MGRPVSALQVEDEGSSLLVRFGAINKKNLGEKDV